MGCFMGRGGCNGRSMRMPLVFGRNLEWPIGLANNISS